MLMQCALMWIQQSVKMKDWMNWHSFVGTSKAMGGGVSFQEALSQRLNILKPTQQQLTDFIMSHPPKLSPGIKDLVSSLRERNKMVFLVSGGFRQIINPVADMLGLPQEHIYANRLIFDQDGNYSHFDLSEPTCESGGKPRVVKMIQDKYNIQSVVFIGDGATDMEACPPADAFIGYGGNVIREPVKRNASWFVTSFQPLLDELC